jgi:hypothetical protein
MRYFLMACAFVSGLVYADMPSLTGRFMYRDISAAEKAHMLYSQHMKNALPGSILNSGLWRGGDTYFVFTVMHFSSEKDRDIALSAIKNDAVYTDADIKFGYLYAYTSTNDLGDKAKRDSISGISVSKKEPDTPKEDPNADLDQGIRK